MQRILHLLVITLLPLSLFAQAPQKMNYQAVIRNSSGALVTSKAIGMRVSILQGTANGTEVYKEIYNPNPQTNANGLVSIEIGGGVPVTGTFAGINWANGPYFIKTEADPNGGTAYSIIGTSQLLSVPYALYAGNVVNGVGKPIIYLTGDITNAQAQAKIAAEVGPNTQGIRIENCRNLTAIDLSNMTKAVEILITDNQNLQSLNLSKLEETSTFIISSCPKLTSIDVSSLKHIGGFDEFFINNTGLTNISFNSLTYINSIDVSNNKLLTTISFSSLTRIGNYFIVQLNPNLSSVAINNLSDFSGDIVQMYSNKLPSSQINALLNTFVNITPALTGKSFYFSNQNPTAPPTGQGLTDKATLISRGNTVSTD